MEVEIMRTMIGTVGFPIAVTIYLLYERSKSYKELCNLIEEDVKITRQLMTLIESKL